MSALIQPVIGDTPSQEVELLRQQVNVLVAYVVALQAAVAGSSDYATLKTAIGAVDVSGLRTIALTRTPAPAPRFPTHG